MLFYIGLKNDFCKAFFRFRFLIARKCGSATIIRLPDNVVKICLTTILIIAIYGSNGGYVVNANIFVLVYNVP